MDEFDRLADLESEIYRQAAEAGHKQGRLEGFANGETLGHTKGVALASEVGFYLGTLESILQASEAIEGIKSASNGDSSARSTSGDSKQEGLLSDKIRKSIDLIRSLAIKFDATSALDPAVAEELYTIRSKFKQICSQLGLKMRFTGSTFDKVGEDQLSPGMTPIDF